MPFDDKEVNDLLVRCHRRCCICHKICGVKIEVDHIIQKTDGGTDDIDNAIPVCFECHAEIHLYNPSHPKGRRFHPPELRAHRDQWLLLCADHPEAVTNAGSGQALGSLERLIYELEFNQAIASYIDPKKIGCVFEVAQFDAALADGTLLWLVDPVGKAIREAYLAMKQANPLIKRSVFIEHANVRATATGIAQHAINYAGDAINKALEAIHAELSGSL